MRVFTFLLMMTVAVGGTLMGYRLVTGKDLISLADFGIGAQAGSRPPVAVPVAAATPTPSPVPPSALPTPTPTLIPDIPQVMLVGNTDGQGVYLRRTPRMDDKLRAWQDGTRMEVTGRIVQGDGRQWRKVRAPDGTEGYIPEEFLKGEP